MLLLSGKVTIKKRWKMKTAENNMGNMNLIYSILHSKKRCTIFDLQKVSKLGNIDLCTALGYLLQRKRISQKREDGAVYYEPM